MARQLITNSDLSPLLEIFNWLLLSLIVITVSGRTATKFWVVRRADSDDGLILAALALSIAQSVATSIAISNGVGQHLNTLKLSQVDALQKASYAANLLLVPSLCFAKASVLAVLYNLSPVKSHQRLSIGLGVIVILWTVTSEFVAAFQCSLPSPWQFLDNTCANRVAAYNYIVIMNLFTDMLLILLPCVIVGNLQLAISKKIIVLLTFVSRILAVTATICQLVYLNRASESQDLVFDQWPALLCAQITQCLSIVTACMVYMRPFLDSLETGFLRVDDQRRRGTASYGYTFGNRKPFQGTASTNGSKSRGPAWSTLSSKIGVSTSTSEPREAPIEGAQHGHQDNLYIMQTRSWQVRAE